MSNSLSAKHISANLGQYEAARSGFFSFVVDKKINGIIRANAKDRLNATDAYRIANVQEPLKLNVTKCDVPHFSLEVLEYRRGNDVVKFAGVPTFQSGSLTVDDVVGLDTKSILMAWHALAYDVYSRKGGRMKDYKFNCTLVEYTQDFEIIRSWNMFGCWISEISEDAFDKTSDGKRQITATFQYDRAEMVMPNLEEEAE